jgi:8-oxo-dGTP pyrophosphatase MutT (NUDIX family)
MINETEYFNAIQNFPNNSDANIKLIRDRDTILNFEKTTGKPIGIILNEPFYNYQMDLFEDTSSRQFRYCHICYPNSKRGAVSLVVFHTNTGDFILLEYNFRIFLNSFCYEIPRGFVNKEDISSLSCALRELSEETNLNLDELEHRITPLGNVAVDSGLSNNIVDLYAIELWVDSIPPLQNNDIAEDIKGYELLTAHQIKEKILTNEINDSFTIVAVLKYFLTNINKDSLTS